MDIRSFYNTYFAYFRDDNITWRYIDVNYSSNKNVQIFGDGSIPSSLFTMDVIYPFIKDLPKELKFKLSNTEREDYQWAEKLHEWLMKNRNSVKFNYDVNDGWFWSD
jgi:hypothetical protein